jgi:glycosyltransferase involved in cell wall biosynthesis
MAFTLVTVLVPANNEAQSLEELFARTHEVMVALGQPYEFLVVDDGSRDATADVVKALRLKHPQVGLLVHGINHGKSLALMQGFYAARGDVIVTMDADLQDSPEEIPQLLEALRSGYDLAGGWRKARKDPFAKRCVSWIYNSLIRLISGSEYKDINCGFKAFTKAVADRLELTGDMHRLIPALAASYGFKVTEVPVIHNPRRHGASRYHLLRHRGLLDIIVYAVLRTTQIRPFHIMCEIGFVCLCLSLVLAFAAWMLRDPQAHAVLDFFFFFAVLLSAGFGLVGVLCPMTGLIVECVAMNRQDRSWRSSLVTERLLAGMVDAPAPTEDSSRDDAK